MIAIVYWSSLLDRWLRLLERDLDVGPFVDSLGLLSYSVAYWFSSPGLGFDYSCVVFWRTPVAVWAPSTSLGSADSLFPYVSSLHLQGLNLILAAVGLPWLWGFAGLRLFGSSFLRSPVSLVYRLLVLSSGPR